MASQPEYIVDASVASKWFLRLPDEPHIEIAEVVIRGFEMNRIRLTAPSHIRSELGNTLTRAVRRNRISSDEGRAALERFYSLDIKLVPHSGILLGGYELARRFGCSFYDATYLALAVMTDSPFLHADNKLRNALGGQFPHELWLEDYLG